MNENISELDTRIGDLEDEEATLKEISELSTRFDGLTTKLNKLVDKQKKKKNSARKPAGTQAN